MKIHTLDAHIFLAFNGMKWEIINYYGVCKAVWSPMLLPFDKWGLEKQTIRFLSTFQLELGGFLYLFICSLKTSFRVSLLCAGHCARYSIRTVGTHSVRVCSVWLNRYLHEDGAKKANTTPLNQCENTAGDLWSLFNTFGAFLLR